MTTSFDYQLDKMNEKIIDTFGVDAVYTDSEGAVVVLKVIRNQSYPVQGDGFSTTSAVVHVVEARVSDIGQVPSRGDTFTMEGIEYLVDDVPENSGGWVKCIMGEVVP